MTRLPSCEVWISPDGMLHLLPLSRKPISSQLLDMPAASSYMSETTVVTQRVTATLTPYMIVTILIRD